MNRNTSALRKIMARIALASLTACMLMPCMTLSAGTLEDGYLPIENTDGYIDRYDEQYNGIDSYSSQLNDIDSYGSQLDDTDSYSDQFDDIDSYSHDDFEGSIDEAVVGAYADLLPNVAHSSVSYTNPETGYRVRVEDYAGLLIEGQADMLAESMKQVTAYSDAAFVTVDADVDWYNLKQYAGDYLYSMFGNNGVLLMINMSTMNRDNRSLEMVADGPAYEVIDAKVCETIADNIYRYAGNGDYYGCAEEAFSQVFAKFEGRRIAQPMKYICNFILALIAAMFINYLYAKATVRTVKASDSDVIVNTNRRFAAGNFKRVLTNQTRQYVSSSSSSSGGGFYSGGSHSSGGFHGGGGSHGGGRSGGFHGGGGGHRF